jgi:hypothetical protein
MDKKREAIPQYSEEVSRFMTFLSTHASMTVNLTSEVAYNQRQVIEDDVLDRNFKFSVPTMADGTEKVYFSIPFILADTTYRNTNMDSKDLQVKSDNYSAIDWIPLIRGAVKNYLKVYNFDELMNDIRRELIDMGHVITKEVGNETKIVSLLNIVRPSDIMNIQDGGVAEASYMTFEQLEMNKEEWKDNWGKILELKGIMDSVQRKTYRIYEWWTVDEFTVGGQKKRTKGCHKFLDCSMFDSTVADVPENWSPYLLLESFSSPYFEKVQDKNRLKKLKALGLIENGDQERIFPYCEERLVKVHGRWKGMGYYELLRNEGKAFQKTMNEKLRYDELLHKGIIVHTKAPFASKGMGRGIESDVINRIQTGTMISIKSGEKLDRLNLGSLTADFLATAEAWFKLARQKVGVSEIAIGDKMQASTTATTAVINERQSKNAFDIVNEQQGLFFANLFSRFKIKEIIDEITEQEWTKIIGSADELKRMEEAFIENLVKNAVINSVNEGRIIPEGSSLPPEDLERYKQAVQVARSKQGEARFAQFKKDLIKDFEFNVSFLFNNNVFDRQVVLNSIDATINAVIGNPMSEIDVNKLVEMKADIMGLDVASIRKSPQQIEADRAAAIAAQQPAGAVNPLEGIGKEFGQSNQQGI